MKNDANIRNFIEYLGNLHGKSWKICGKSFHFFPFHSTTSFGCPVFRGRFRSFSVVFSVISGENRRISEKNGEYRRHLSVFIPFLSTSLHFHSSFSNQPDFMLYNMFIVDTLSERLNV